MLKTWTDSFGSRGLYAVHRRAAETIQCSLLSSQVQSDSQTRAGPCAKIEGDRPAGAPDFSRIQALTFFKSSQNAAGASFAIEQSSPAEG